MLKVTGDALIKCLETIIVIAIADL